MSQDLRDRLIGAFDTMPRQLQRAARYVLDHPDEVALVSMREVARNAGVQPSTMTRLAKFLKLDGYDDIRSDHARAIRLRARGSPPSRNARRPMQAWPRKCCKTCRNRSRD